MSTMDRRSFLKAASGASIAGLAGCTALGIGDAEDALELVYDEGNVLYNGTAVVTGTIENTSERELSYVQANALFYDGSGDRIGTGVDTITHLQAKTSWEFMCVYYSATSYLTDSYDTRFTAEW